MEKLILQQVFFYILRLYFLFSLPYKCTKIRVLVIINTKGKFTVCSQFNQFDIDPLSFKFAINSNNYSSKYFQIHPRWIRLQTPEISTRGESLKLFERRDERQLEHLAGW